MSSAPHSARSLDNLSICALIYLAIPNLIFVFGWFRIPIAISLSLLLIILLTAAGRPGNFFLRGRYTRSAIGLIILLAAALAAFGGGSHFVYANPDWVIRDAVQGDLLNAPWPVAYKFPDGSIAFLRSAIGYFLPTALLGKLLGSTHMNLYVFTWTAVGIALFFMLLPLKKQFGVPLLLGLTVATFFSGMDLLGQVISTQDLPLFPLRLEWWGPLSYPSLMVQLLWAPNHALPIWIATLLILRYWDDDYFIQILAAVLPLSLIWTPFAAIGLAPFAALGTYRLLTRFGLKELPWREIIVALLYSAPVCMFLTIDIAQIESGFANQTFRAGLRSTPTVTQHQYLIFVFCEFLLLAIALLPVVKDRRELFWLSVFILLLLPLIGYGPSNDALLRLSTPPLIVLLGICLQSIFSEQRPLLNGTRWILWTFLLIGAHSGFNELWRAISYKRWPADYSQSLTDRTNGRLAPHYMGRSSNTIMDELLRPTSGAISVRVLPSDHGSP